MTAGADGPTYTVRDLRERLRSFEIEFKRDSEDFLAEWETGLLPHDPAYFAWAGLCARLGVGVRELA